MRLKLLSVFVATQLLSFGIWHALYQAEPVVVQASEPTQVHAAPEAKLSPVADTPEVTLSLHFAVRNMDEGRHFLNSIKQNQIETALKKMPQAHADSVENIILDYNPQAHRGLGGNSLIILRAVNMSTEEMVGVLIHELGHNVDYAYLSPENTERKSTFLDGKTPVYESDPSLDFYRISWLSDSKRKKAATKLDFVSGYAMTDPFEDFAESYVYYVFHNKDFKQLAASSKALYAKYRFMKYEVFGGAEFDSGEGQVDENKRPWDITVLNYDVAQFLS